MNYEYLWKTTHESKCPQSSIIKNDFGCECHPDTRIRLLQHILAGCTLDQKTREAMLEEIQKCINKERK